VGSALELAIDARAENVVLHGPEACRLTLPNASPTEALRVSLEPLITLEGPASDVGFDAPFQIAVRTGCAAARRGTLAWNIEGAPLASLSITDSGYRVTARTTRMPEVLSAWPPGHLVPVSPGERATTRLVARWTSPTGAVVVRSISVSAAPRSRGLPNVALGERVLLAGSGYRVVQRPEGALAEPMPWSRSSPPLTSLVPDVAGTWLLEAPNGRTSSIHARRYDEVSFDCGECHGPEARAAHGSPMSAAFVRRLDSPEDPAALACTFGCHTTGEPGVADGGFSHALSELELDAAALPAWEDLPRSLRRLGGVACVACHGPAQIPEPAARSGILRAEVCGYCHDAPPRYEHVRAWRSTGLARSDHRPETRSSAECARCHTTWGFLAELSGNADSPRMPLEDEPAMGITCSACHAVHSEGAVRPALLRRAPIDPIYEDVPEGALERSSTCIFCHTPGPYGGPSSALIWAGRGALDPWSGLPLVGPAPHAAAPGGCVACHGSDSAGARRGSGHDFRATSSRCSSCHAERPLDHHLFERARHLLNLGTAALPTDEPPHARPSLPITPQERALALARLVLEDPGAAVHNPGYATLLLDRAAAVLATPDPAALASRP
jgi:hypothetical protein